MFQNKTKFFNEKKMYHLYNLFQSSIHGRMLREQDSICTKMLTDKQ